MTTTTAPIQLCLALFAPTCWHCPAPVARLAELHEACEAERKAAREAAKQVTL